MGDENKDGKVSAGEFAKLLDNLLTTTFTKLDKNKNKKLDSSEIVRLRFVHSSSEPGCVLDV